MFGWTTHLVCICSSLWWSNIHYNVCLCVLCSFQFHGLPFAPARHICYVYVLHPRYERSCKTTLSIFMYIFVFVSCFRWTERFRLNFNFMFYVCVLCNLRQIQIEKKTFFIYMWNYLICDFCGLQREPTNNGLSLC